jgi:hypothetical protein
MILLHVFCIVDITDVFPGGGKKSILHVYLLIGVVVNELIGMVVLSSGHEAVTQITQ